MVPAIVAMLFSFGTAGVVLAGVSRMRDGNQGILAGVTLIGTDYYMRHGASQYADTPLSFFILAAVVLLCIHAKASHGRTGPVWLAGAMAGFAAWTKNEGLIFVASIITAQLVVLKWRQDWGASWKQILWFLAGLAPVLAIVAYFKASLAPMNDLLVSQESASTAAKLLDVSRYTTVGRFLVRKFLSFGNGLPFVLAGCFLLLGWGPDRRQWRCIALSAAVLLLMLCAYFLVYVATPQDLDWHLGTSAKRLLLQLFPLAVFTAFMMVATPRGRGKAH